MEAAISAARLLSVTGGTTRAGGRALDRVGAWPQAESQSTVDRKSAPRSQNRKRRSAGRGQAEMTARAAPGDSAAADGGHKLHVAFFFKSLKQAKAGDVAVHRHRHAGPQAAIVLDDGRLHAGVSLVEPVDQFTHRSTGRLDHRLTTREVLHGGRDPDARHRDVRPP